MRWSIGWAHRISWCAGLLLLAGLASSALGDWPLARGDIAGTGIAATKLTDHPNVLWTYDAPEDAGFDASAVVAGGVVYVGDSNGTLHAVRLEDGTAVWTKQFPEAPFGAAGAVEGDRLYVGDLNGEVRCLDTADGEVVWSYTLDAEVYAGPMPYDDTVLVTSESGTLVALAKRDGTEKWRFTIDSPLRCSPTIAGGRAMVSGCDSLLHIINAETGEEEATVQIDAPTGSTPAMRDARVYFGTEGGTFYAIEVPADNPQNASIAWQYRDSRRGQPIRSAAAVSDEIAVYGSQGKAIYGLLLANGEPKWKLATRSRVESSPVIANGRVVAATTAGKIYLLDIASGEPKWEFDAGGGFMASPAVVDGRIVLGNTDGTLYCFGGKAQD